jgi:hemoglobin
MTARMIPCLLLAALAVSGCGTSEKQNRDFHTSGSREADQRAEQRVAKVQQLRGEGEQGKQGDGAAVKASLYERLGGQDGIEAIVSDFIDRALADPRVNWKRQGIRRGGVLGIGDDSVEWDASPQNVQRLKKHIAQFVALSTGGPTQYQGQDMRQSHEGLRITNDEFDAAVGDLKASLDAARVPAEEQKELLSIIESTRPQVVEKR